MVWEDGGRKASSYPIWPGGSLARTSVGRAPARLNLVGLSAMRHNVSEFYRQDSKTVVKKVVKLDCMEMEVKRKCL